MQVNFYIEKAYEDAWAKFKNGVSLRGVGQAILYMCTDPECIERVAWQRFLPSRALQADVRDARVSAVLDAHVTARVNELRSVYNILLPMVKPGDTVAELFARLPMKDAWFMLQCRELWDPR